MHEGGFNWLSKVPILRDWPNHVAMTLLICGALILLMAVARTQLVRTMRSNGGGLVPDETWTLKNFFEIVAEALYGLTESVIGHHDAARFFPVVGTLFIFVFACNLVGLIPGFLPPTDNLNTTLALGTFVFVYYNYSGIRANGLVTHLKHLMGPIWWLAPLMFVIEVVSHLFRPISLALRLRGNIMGDHIVLGVFSSFVPVVVPVIFMGLGVFVAFIQAFVFCLMTMVYISLSTAHDEH